MWTNIRKQEIFIIKVTGTRENAPSLRPKYWTPGNVPTTFTRNKLSSRESCFQDVNVRNRQILILCKCLHCVSIPANKTQLKSVQVMKENSLERHWGSSQKSKRLQEIRITSVQVYHQKRKRLFFQFQSENPRTFYLMVLTWVTCKPQEQSLWPKRARLLSEKGGAGGKHWPQEEFSFWYPRKGHGNQLWAMSFLYEYKGY